MVLEDVLVLSWSWNTVFELCFESTSQTWSFDFPFVNFEYAHGLVLTWTNFDILKWRLDFLVPSKFTSNFLKSLIVFWIVLSWCRKIIVHLFVPWFVWKPRSNICSLSRVEVELWIVCSRSNWTLLSLLFQLHSQREGSFIKG